MRKKVRDEEMFLWFREYAIPAITIGVRSGAWGKNKVEYAECPISSMEENKEKKLQQQRELFMQSLLNMKSSFELTHKPTDK